MLPRMKVATRESQRMNFMSAVLSSTQQISGTSMVALPGGTFQMGSDRHYPEEAPQHPVRVSAFSIDVTNVTNAEFARFIDATGYVTVAERPLDPALYPGAD